MTDVIVIGGGIAGCSTARFLAADGVEVLLLERSDLATQASGLNAGSLHAQIQHDPFVGNDEAWVRDYLPALPFYRYAIDLWQELASEFGDVLEFSRDGGIIVATTTAQMREIETKTRYEQAAGLGTELLDVDALRKLAPYISGEMIGGAFCPLEGKASPLKSTTALATSAAAAGASLLCNCDVTDISRIDTGYSVTTSQGVFEAPRIVNAAGSDVGRIAALVGARIDVAAYPIQLSVTEPMAPLVSHLVYSAENLLTLKQNRAGSILVGGGWPAALDPDGRVRVRPESLVQNLALATRVVPELAEARLVRSWAGIVNGTDSWLPMLGELPGTPGFFINYVPWMGFTGGPAGGRIVASQVQGLPPPVEFDLEPLRPVAQ